MKFLLLEVVTATLLLEFGYCNVRSVQLLQCWLVLLVKNLFFAVVDSSAVKFFATRAALLPQQVALVNNRVFQELGNLVTVTPSKSEYSSSLDL